MNNDYLVKQSTLSDIANNIRRITGAADGLTLSSMIDNMNQYEPNSGSSSNIVFGTFTCTDQGASKVTIPELINCSNCIILRDTNTLTRAIELGDFKVIVIYDNNTLISDFDATIKNNISFNSATGQIDIDDTGFMFSYLDIYTYTYIGW